MFRAEAPLIGCTAAVTKKPKVGRTADLYTVDLIARYIRGKLAPRGNLLPPTPCPHPSGRERFLGRLLRSGTCWALTAL
jgi:hypothetical protein